jgi:rubredoxin
VEWNGHVIGRGRQPFPYDHEWDAADQRWSCPACGYPDLREAPYENWPGLPTPDIAHPPYQAHFGAPSFEGCPSCGFEFGVDDDAGASGSATSFTEWRQAWIDGGCVWWARYERKPRSWDGRRQLADAGLEPD